MMLSEEKKWHVLITMSRSEKSIYSRLLEMGVEAYCPLTKTVKKWSDRKKIVVEPLFRNYVFVKVTKAERFDILQESRALNYMYWLGQPAVVRDHEIESIRAFLEEYDHISVSNYAIKKEASVVVIGGALQQQTGIVKELCGNQVKVLIKSLGIELIATLPVSKVELIKLPVSA